MSSSLPRGPLGTDEVKFPLQVHSQECEWVKATRLTNGTKNPVKAKHPVSPSKSETQGIPLAPSPNRNPVSSELKVELSPDYQVKLLDTFICTKTVGNLAPSWRACRHVLIQQTMQQYEEKIVSALAAR